MADLFSPVCMLNAGSPRPAYPYDVGWNEVLEDDLKDFLDRRVFPRFLRNMEEAFKLIAPKTKYKSITVSTDKFKFYAQVVGWGMQEDTYVPTACSYNTGELELEVSVVLENTTLTDIVKNVQWRPESDYKYRAEGVVRGWMRENHTEFV